MSSLRLALRLCRKSPGFTALVLATLALGIGANTAIFSLVYGAFLRPLPYPDADRLVHISEATAQSPDLSVSYPDFLDWKASQDVFSGLAVYRAEGATLQTPGGAEEVTVAEVSGDFFGVMGLHSAQGRDLDARDDRVGAPPAVWLTHSTWERLFQQQAGMVGRTVTLNGVATVVAGILPADFRFHRHADAFIPIEPAADAQFLRQRENHTGLYGIAKLKPGVALAQAGAELSAVGERLQREYPSTNSGTRPRLVPLRARLEGDAAPRLMLLMAAVGLLLLVVCVNVANLLLARSFQRRREMAIRTALGATRRQLFGQLLAESLLLAGGGGILGAVLGRWGYALVARLAPPEMRELIHGPTGFDYGVWLAVAGLALLTGVAFGLAPAWQLSQANPNDALKNGRPLVRTLWGRLHLSDALVLLQVLLAVTLLVDAGLLIRSLQRLTAFPTGIRPEHVITLRVSSPAAAAMTKDPGAFIRFHETLLAQAKGRGDILSAAFASSLPYTGNQSSNSFFRPDRPLPAPGHFPESNVHVVTPDYFKTLGIPLVRGAAFDGNEPRPAFPPGQPLTMASLRKIYANFTVSAVISRKMADRFWPGENPLGKTFQIGLPEMSLPQLKIVGVAGDTTQFGAERGDQVEFYVPLAQLPEAMTLHLIARTREDPAAAAASLREAIHQAAPGEPIFDVETMTQRISDFSSGRRFSMELFLFFAATALVLASTGIYGVVAFLVGQRSREIGIRMALGARRSGVLLDVLARGLKLALPGAGLGLVAGWAGSRALQSQLFGISGGDAPTYLASGLLALAAALIACAMPALRASRIDPAQALRSE
ncbi:MAG TPA: ABC transporter permease [Opitutaceae bacterium]|nr:ABC transporter permease [Opitutaceae bacterium]